jgi:hypothetical protein
MYQKHCDKSQREAIVWWRTFLSAFVHRQSTGRILEVSFYREAQVHSFPQPLRPKRRNKLCYSFVLILIINGQGHPLENAPKAPPATDKSAALYCPVCAVEVRDPLTCGDCSAVICRRCGTPLESSDELGMG